MTDIVKSLVCEHILGGNLRLYGAVMLDNVIMTSQCLPILLSGVDKDEG